MKQQWKGGTLLAPVPAAMVTCPDGDGANIVTVAWTGILCSDPPRTYISLRKSRYSYDLIKKSGTFVINLTNRALTKATDLCGVRSGRDTDKLAATGLSVEPAPVTGCPMLTESPVSLECRVFEVKELGSHDMFLADIVSVNVDPKYIDENGKLRLEKAKLTAYCHGAYFALGERLGTFGYSVMKKKTRQRKAADKKRK